MTRDQGKAVAQTIADSGDLALELVRRAAGWGEPFGSIWQKAADLIGREEARGQ